MSPAQLIEIAKRKGQVRWLKSGLIEHVFINQNGWVRTKPITPNANSNDLKLVADYNCEEVTPVVPLPAWDQP
jgi:hypothetical protein